MSATETAPAPPEYSRAFENLVEDDNDIVGLLAYALFKQSVREAAQERQPAAFSRNPPASVVKTYRLSAERRLEEFASVIVDAQRAELMEGATVEAIKNAASEIRAHTTQRTGFGSALLTNVVAWVLTLAITVFIIWLSGKGGPEDVIVEAGKKADAARAAIPARPTTSAASPGGPAT
jgi:hypothetical protein